ncbi:MAG: hypothetical protein V3T17_14290 [Pseudomonadales bacterium]
MTLRAPSYRLEVGTLKKSKFTRQVFNTALIDNRLLSLSVTLNSGVSSDQLTISLDNSPVFMGLGAHISPPSQKAIKVSMGYDFNLLELGIFTDIDVTLQSSSAGETLNISATPNLMRDETSETHREITLGALIGKFADRYVLEVALDNALIPLGTTNIPLNQQWESALSYLSKIADYFDAVVKPIAGKLLFLKKGQGTAISGIAVPTVKLQAYDIISWHCDLSTGQEQNYGAVVARYFDYQNATEVEVEAKLNPVTGNVDITTSEDGTTTTPVGVASTTHRMPTLCKNKAEAEKLAASKLAELRRNQGPKLNLTLQGNPRITAEGSLQISGLHSEVSGGWLSSITWIVKSVTHTYSSGGYQTRLTAYQKL